MMGKSSNFISAVRRAARNTALLALVMVLFSMPAAAEPSSFGGLEQAIFQLINKERTSRGLDALALSQRLSDSARRHSSDMASQDYFSHVNRRGESPWERLEKSGISFTRSGENIYLQPRVKRRTYGGGRNTVEYYSDSEMARLIVDGWMKSPGHRANILTAQFTESGMGIAQGTHDNSPFIYVTQNFCRP